MNLTFNVTEQADPEVLVRVKKIESAIQQILASLGIIVQKEDNLSVELDNLTAEVERSKTVDDSITALLNGIAAQLAAIKNDPAKIQALSDSLKSNNDEIAAAVTANTPADTGGSPPVA